MGRRIFPDIYVLRHGETRWNAEGRFQGERDSDLTELGQMQARSMGQALRARGVTAQSHTWVSSPAGRAVATMQIILAEIGGAPEVRTDRRLTEIGMGDWTGRTRTEIDRHWPGPVDEGLMAFYARVPGGERFAELAGRVADFLDGIDRPTVIVTHGMTSRFLRGAVVGVAPDDLGQLPGGHGVIHHLRDGAATAIPAEGLHMGVARGIGAV